MSASGTSATCGDAQMKAASVGRCCGKPRLAVLGFDDLEIVRHQQIQQDLSIVLLASTTRMRLLMMPPLGRRPAPEA